MKTKNPSKIMSSETNCSLRVTPEVRDGIKAIAVATGVQTFAIVNDIMTAYIQANLKPALEDLAGLGGKKKVTKR